MDGHHIFISLFFVSYLFSLLLIVVLSALALSWFFLNLLICYSYVTSIIFCLFISMVSYICSALGIYVCLTGPPPPPPLELSCIIWFYCYCLSSSSPVRHTRMIWKVCLHCSGKFLVASFFGSLNWSRQNPWLENFVWNQEIAYLWETYLYRRTIQLFPWTICIADYKLFVRNLVIRLSIVCDDHNWHELVQAIPARRFHTLLLSVAYDGLGSMHYRALPQLLVTQDLGSNDLEFCLKWALHWPQKEMPLYCCRRASTLLCLHMLYQPLASFNLDLHYINYEISVMRFSFLSTYLWTGTVSHCLQY
jgi:hypothetical protein